MKEHEELIQKAEEAIRNLFSDETVPQSETAGDMNVLQDFISTMLDALD